MLSIIPGSPSYNISSSGISLFSQPGSLGVFEDTGGFHQSRPVYKHKTEDLYLLSKDGYWIVRDSDANTEPVFKATNQSFSPPNTGWIVTVRSLYQPDQTITLRILYKDINE